MVVGKYVHADRPSHWVYHINIIYTVVGTALTDSRPTLTHLPRSVHYEILENSQHYSFDLNLEGD